MQNTSVGDREITLALYKEKPTSVWSSVCVRFLCCAAVNSNSQLDLLSSDNYFSTAKMNRATKSGLAAETHAKVNAKYDEGQAEQVLEWIKEVLKEDINTSGDADNFYEILKDGQVLCRLINTLKPGSVKKIQTSSMAFKCMENINGFVTGAKACGVSDTEVFQTVDLWERQNLNSVVICLQALGRKGSNFGQPSIGPKEASKNVREFSEDQLRASEGIINLQYGSNKGASQTGMSFGTTRHM
ncbi:Calponin domain [Trinorchestia longiramus]|nr:Calponin domain [Trinorchestia longiramus]